MLPIKYSFKLLKRAEAKKLKLDFAFNKLQKKIVIVADAKENFEREDLENDNASAELGTSKKRAFLKLAGVVGLGAAASLFIPKRAEALIFGSTPASNVVGIKNSSNVPIDPAIETGGNLEDINTNTGTIATNTAGFLLNNTGAYIRQDNNYTIARETGGNLASINTKVATLATEESNILLRRIAKLSDSLGVVDSAQRQRITIDAGTLPVVTTVSSVTNMVALGGVDGRYLQIDTARNAYANGVRNNLMWT